MILFNISFMRQKAATIIFIAAYVRKRFGECLSFILIIFQWSAINQYFFLFYAQSELHSFFLPSARQNLALLIYPEYYSSSASIPVL